MRRMFVVIFAGFIMAASLLVAPASTAGSSPSYATPEERRNVKLVNDFYRDIFNGQRLDIAHQYIKEDFIQHTPTVEDGIEGFKKFYGEFFFPTFPDVSVVETHTFAQQDRVASYSTWQGTHAKTGVKLYLYTANIYRIEKGLLAEHWEVIDYSQLDEHGIPDPNTDQPTSPINWTGTPAQVASVRLTAAFLDDIFKQKNFDHAGLYVHRNLRQHQPGVEQGLNGFTKYVREAYSYFPDLKVNTDHVVVSGDKVLIFTTWLGNHPGNDTPLHLHTSDIYQVKYGKFAEHWSIMDRKQLEPFDFPSK